MLYHGALVRKIPNLEAPVSIKNIAKMTCVATLILGASASYALNNFTCPASEEINSTDFTAPSIWIAPPVAHSQPGQVGVGLGGKRVGKLLGVESARVGGHDGWVCVYKSEGGTTVRTYEKKIRKLLVENKFLIKYLETANKAFDQAEPYLKHYTQDELGFVGYQVEFDQQQPQQQKKK